jgi:hypothetical protein
MVCSNSMMPQEPLLLLRLMPMGRAVFNPNVARTTQPMDFRPLRVAALKKESGSSKPEAAG